MPDSVFSQPLCSPWTYVTKSGGKCPKRSIGTPSPKGLLALHQSWVCVYLFKLKHTHWILISRPMLVCHPEYACLGVWESKWGLLVLRHAGVTLQAEHDQPLQLWIAILRVSAAQYQEPFGSAATNANSFPQPFTSGRTGRLAVRVGWGISRKGAELDSDFNILVSFTFP